MHLPDDDDDRDKYLAAIHEAGHATVAAVLCWSLGRSLTLPLPTPVAGMTEVQLGGVEAHIRRTETTDPMYEKTWVGSTTHFQINLDKREKATINVAGMVAECLYEDDNIEATSIIDDWQMEVLEPSDTDYTGLPDAWEDRMSAVENALALLRRHDDLWHAVITQLVENELITNGELKKLATRSR